MLPVCIAGLYSRAVWSPDGFAVPFGKRLGIAVRATVGHFCAADPGIECVVGPFDGGVFAHNSPWDFVFLIKSFDAGYKVSTWSIDSAGHSAGNDRF